MEAFSRFEGIVVPVDRANVDTDQIIPKQYLKSIERTGFGPNLFDDWRYLDPGEPGDDHGKRRPNPDFVLNQERYAGAGVLLARRNFGLRLFTGARPLGTAGFRNPCGDCSQFRRYLLQQLLQERHPPGNPG